MNIIKDFNDFERNKIDSNEREEMERELVARKTKRNNGDQHLNISIKLIKDIIKNDIDTNNGYKISLGERVEDLDGSQKQLFHIEYESPSLGRLRFFKPKDKSKNGFYEINGKYYKTNLTEIRDLYHELLQKIKQ